MAVAWLAAPAVITVGSASAWVDITGSDYGVGAAATGVILHLRNTGITSRTVGAQCEGSTDTRTFGLGAGCHNWYAVGCSSTVFHVYTSHTTEVEFYIVGYFQSESVFLVNGTDKSVGTTGSYQDIDISADTGANTALAAFFDQAGAGNSYMRCNGSTNDFYDYNAASFWCVKVDANEICEAKVPATSIDHFLLGYMTDDVVMTVNSTLRSPTTGDWVDLTALNAAASGGIYLARGVGTSIVYGLRKNGTTEDFYYSGQVRHNFGLVQCDTDEVVECKSNSANIYEMGYFETSAAGGATIPVFMRTYQNMRT